MIAGAVSFCGRSAQSVARELANRAAHYAGERCRPLHESDEVGLFVIERANVPGVARSCGEGHERAWLLGDEISNAAPATVAPDMARLADAPIRGRWIAVALADHGKSLAFATDRLGIAWLYVLYMDGICLFASDFLALAKTLGARARLDPEVAISELTLGHTPSDRTIFEQIQLAPAGACFTLESSGLRLRTRRVTKYGNRNATASREMKFAHLDQIYERITADCLGRRPSGLVLSISAGFDSRYGLAYLDRNDRVDALCTFGDPRSDEVQGADEICGRVGRKNDVFRVPGADFGQWARTIQSLGNCGMTQWSGWAESWLDFLTRHGQSVMIGYLGDALTGKHIGKVADHADPIGFWLRFHGVSWWERSPLLVEKRRLDLTTRLRHQLEEAIAECEFAFAHQRLLHLDLYGRQRRWVASQPNWLQRRVAPELFFYDEELIDFWCNLPVDDLIQQRLYRDFAVSRFPRLFSADEGLPPSAAVRLRRFVLRRTARRATPDHLARHPPVIDHRNILVPNRGHILDLAKRVAPIAAPILDMQAFCEAIERYDGTSSSNSSMLMRVVNLLHLLHACHGGEARSRAGEGASVR